VVGGCLLVSGWLGEGEAASWAIAGRVRDVMRCGSNAMQSAATVGPAPDCRSFRLGSGAHSCSSRPVEIRRRSTRRTRCIQSAIMKSGMTLVHARLGRARRRPARQRRGTTHSTRGRREEPLFAPVSLNRVYHDHRWRIRRPSPAHGVDGK